MKVILYGGKFHGETLTLCKIPPVVYMPIYEKQTFCGLQDGNIKDIEEYYYSFLEQDAITPQGINVARACHAYVKQPYEPEDEVLQKSLLELLSLSPWRILSKFDMNRNTFGYLPVYHGDESVLKLLPIRCFH